MEKKFLLLSFEEKTKKIQLPETVQYEFIRQQVWEKFRLAENQVHMKYFDTDVNEYVDLDTDSLDNLDNTNLSNTFKVKICKNTNCTNQQLIPAIPAPVSADENTEYSYTPSVSPQTSRGSTPVPVTSAQPFPSTSNDITIPERMNSPTPLGKSTSTPSSPSLNDTRKTWPRMYNFPVGHLPQALKLKLEMKEPLERIERSRLLDVLYSDVTQYERGLYPSSDMYEQIIDGLLRQYPHLVKESGIPLQSVRVYWKEKLKYKWGNERKSRDKNLPEVRAKKRKSTQEATVTTEVDNVKNINLTWGMANYLPPQHESEDETAVALHVQWLKKEFMKTEKDDALVNLKMKLSLPSRRKDIVKEGMAISDILEKYPFLKDRRQILLEFSRLGPNCSIDNNGIEEVFYNALDDYYGPIISIIKGRKMIPQVKEVVDLIPLQRTEGERKYAAQCAAILGSGQLFKEKVEKILCFPGENHEDQPAVELIFHDKILTMNNNMFELKIDGHTIYVCDTFLELFIGFLASIYCFNLVYPKSVVKTLTFFQNVFLKLNDGKMDKKIVSVVAELNKERTKQK